MKTVLHPEYVVITPAYNEEKYIEYPLRSMLKQTQKPLKWYIIDDGSNDNTALIINKYARQYDWIKYHYTMKELGRTYYSSNVYAILEGVKLTRGLKYTHLAILDADIELCDDYYERIFRKFTEDVNLGIATGLYLEKEANKWIPAKIDRRSTPKAIQVFKRECYESCRGYIPFRYGGEDSGIEIMARMKGWETRSFEDILVKHHRPVGTGDGSSLLHARFRQGITEYCIGTHPFFMLLKSIKRMFIERPYCLSGVARLFGYSSGYLNRYERQLPNQAIEFLRKEQLNRITNSLFPG